MDKACEVLKKLDKRSCGVLDIIQKKGPISKKELINITDMKLTTLNRELELLEKLKLISETDIGESTGGRRPMLLDVSTNKFYSIGIDISRTYVEIVLTNLKVDIIGEKRAYGLKDINSITKFIIEGINDLLNTFNINGDEVLGIGIGIVKGYNLDTFLNVLAKHIDSPVIIDNGANAAVVGEYYFGEGRYMENVCYINCGVGIRTGVISSGTLIRTINNAEDAFGHMIVETDGELCSCGNHGCIEAYASINKIEQKFKRELIRENKISRGDIKNIDYLAICKMGENGDMTASRVIKEAAAYFGTGLANLVRLLDFKLVMLNGPLIANSKLFYDLSIHTAMKKLGVSQSDISFSRGGHFNNKAISVGAAVMVFQKLLNDMH